MRGASLSPVLDVFMLLSNYNIGTFIYIISNGCYASLFSVRALQPVWFARYLCDKTTFGKLAVKDVSSPCIISGEAFSSVHLVSVNVRIFSALHIFLPKRK